MNIQFPQQNPVQAPIEQPNAVQKQPSHPHLPQIIQQNITKPKKSWNDRAIDYLDKWDAKLEAKMPNFEIQNKIDRLGQMISKKFEPLEKFNQWLDSNGQGKWYLKLATFLVKLPARAVRNIIRLLYNIIKGIIYTTIHPLKSLNNIAKLIIHLVHELTLPETWSRIGVGMIGASVGQALITGNPVSVFGVGIGIALLTAGLTVGALKAAIHGEKGHKMQEVKHNLISQAKQLPEAALTGFCMGLIMGGIQKAVYDHQMKTFRITNYDDAQQYAKTFIKENHLPRYTQVELDATGKIVIKWSGDELLRFKQSHPSFLQGQDANEFATFAKLEILPEKAELVIRFNGYNGFEGYHYNAHTPLEIPGRIYPLPPENINLSKYGALGGAVTAFDSIL